MSLATYKIPMTFIRITKIEEKLDELTLFSLKLKKGQMNVAKYNIEITLITVTKTDENLNKQAFLIFSEPQKWLNKRGCKYHI